MEFGKWTKISDQLPPEPKEYKYYLCTVENNHVVAMKYCRARVRGKEILRWEHYGRISPWDVIAYMPFPEAFTE